MLVENSWEYCLCSFTSIYSFTWTLVIPVVWGYFAFLEALNELCLFQSCNVCLSMFVCWQASGTLPCAVSGAPPPVPVALWAVPSVPSEPTGAVRLGGHSRDSPGLTARVRPQHYGPTLLHLLFIWREDIPVVPCASLTHCFSRLITTSVERIPLHMLSSPTTTEGMWGNRLWRR